MPPNEPTLRLATLPEANLIDSLMKASTREIFPRFYDERQVESSIRYVSAVDRTLIADGTYFVLDAEGELVGCGGWSRRDKLYAGTLEGDTDAPLLDPNTQPAFVRAMFVRSDWTRHGLGTRILEACESAAKADGFRNLALMATLPGIPLYEHYGFHISERLVIPLADGVNIGMAAMEKEIL